MNTLKDIREWYGFCDMYIYTFIWWVKGECMWSCQSIKQLCPASPPLKVPLSHSLGFYIIMWLIFHQSNTWSSLTSPHFPFFPLLHLLYIPFFSLSSFPKIHTAKLLSPNCSSSFSLLGLCNSSFSLLGRNLIHRHGFTCAYFYYLD